MRNVNIISLGSELTSGEVVNTNAAYISQELTKKGLHIASIVTCPDDFDAAVRYIKRFFCDDSIFIFTGGLGGTRDDITRKIVSRVVKKEFLIDKEKVQLLEQWYKKKNRYFGTADRMQASCPAGGRLLENEVGLAYGFYIKHGGHYIFSLPGVPREMKSMFDKEVLSIIEEENLFNKKYKYEIISFSNIPEYTLDREINKIIVNFKGILYGTRANYGIIRVRIESAEEEIEPCLCALENKLHDNFIGRGAQTLPQLIGKFLRSKHLTLAVAESCTGGLLSKTITDVPGSSDYFKGGIVAYSNEVKKKLLFVSDELLQSHGAVSRAAALQMASGVLTELDSDIALSITGIAGPGGGSEQKPVGTVWVGLYSKESEPLVAQYTIKGDRETVRMVSTNRALFMLYKYLKRWTKQ